MSKLKIRLKEVKRHNACDFRKFKGKYEDFEIRVIEANDDPFGPIHDYYQVVVENQKTGDTYFSVSDPDKLKIKSKRKAIQYAMNLIDGLKNNKVTKGDRFAWRKQELLKI